MVVGYPEAEYAIVAVSGDHMEADGKMKCEQAYTVYDLISISLAVVCGWYRHCCECRLARGGLMGKFGISRPR